MNNAPLIITGYMLSSETKTHGIITRRSARCPFCPPEAADLRRSQAVASRKADREKPKATA